MAEDSARQQQYNYSQNSNLVLKADRSLIPRREHDASGEPESLWGRIDIKRMGDRAQRERPTEELQKMREKQLQREKDSERVEGHRKKRSNAREGITTAYGFSSVLDAVDDFEGLTYRPRTTETREAYSLILHFVHLIIGDQSQELLRGATDEILILLKNENMKDLDRKKEIEAILGDQMASEKFAQLINLGKRITDFSSESTGMQEVDDGSAEAMDTSAIDGDVGVAVVFDEEEEDEDENLYEVSNIGDAESEADRDEVPPQDSTEFETGTLISCIYSLSSD